MPRGADEIVRISRQSTPTYFYFREAVLGKARPNGSRDARLKDVVELVAKTPGSVGYGRMGYAMPDVKALRVARRGREGLPPTVDTTLTLSIARPLFMYARRAGRAVKKCLD
jgi:ABC-type phosphate transport system substrate-binding protein